MGYAAWLNYLYYLAVVAIEFYSRPMWIMTVRYCGTYFNFLAFY